jgi:hypothetical protein
MNINNKITIEDLQKYYKPTLLIVSKLLYTYFIIDTIKPYFKTIILFILTIPCTFLSENNFNFSAMILLDFIKFLIKTEDINKIKTKLPLIKKINKYSNNKINILVKKFRLP